MRRLTRALLLAFGASCAIAAAGDPQAPAAPVPTPTPTPVASPGPPPTPAPDIQDFVPTEKVGADDAVAFPTDI